MDRPATLRRIALALTAAALIAGCTRHYPPAPVVASGARPPPLARAEGARPDSIVVAPGETLYGVARRYDVPIRALIDANQLTPPFQLAAGRRLILPHVRQYVVQPGDTLNGVSRRFGVDVSTLARTNHLAPPYPILVGQALVLPAPVEMPPAQAVRPAVAAPPPVVVEQKAIPAPALPPATPAPVVVEQKALPMPALPPVVAVPAPRMAATASDVPREAPARLEPAPPAKPAEPAPLPPEAKAPPARPPIAAAEQAPETPPTANPAGKPPPQVALATPPTAPPEAPANTGRGFLWPVRGPVVIGYGPGAGGTQNDGINIGAAEGTPIVAANDGIVAYAGNELRGFGNLILLKHADGWTTAYAHCSALLVKRGDRVRRGQLIAKVGATGAVHEPQLHFEMRRGTQPLDPTSYLPPLSTAAAQQG